MPRRRGGSSRCTTRSRPPGAARRRPPVPPARLPLRDDLRTRLGWGLVYEVVPLADADKPAALAAYARARGFALSADVIAYLLAHGRRDMPTLVATLAALDRHSLATKRPITVPPAGEWLQRGLGLTGQASSGPASLAHCLAVVSKRRQGLPGRGLLVL